MLQKQEKSAPGQRLARWRSFNSGCILPSNICGQVKCTPAVKARDSKDKDKKKCKHSDSAIVRDVC